MENSSPIKVSVVIPCLNEETSVGICIKKAIGALSALGISHEVVICDNGSTDRTAEAATAAGARVVHQPERGYGAAYLKGIAESKGDWIIIGDGDDTYDFSEIGPFTRELEKGFDFVIGSRFKGTILPGAMPWLHQYIGNPFLSGLLNLLFGLSVSDSHCGLRAFTRSAYEKMGLVTKGMEFASEMVIKSAMANLKVSEVPIVYHTRTGESKLRSFRDGWRHLRFMLLYSPGALFLFPGVIFSVIGWIMMLAMLGGPVTLWGVSFDYHWMFIGSLCAILGAGTIQMGVVAKVFAQRMGLNTKTDIFVEWLMGWFDVDRGMAIGGLSIGTGFLIYSGILVLWVSRGFGHLEAVRPGLIALSFIFIGVQMLFSAFLIGLMGIKIRQLK